MRPHGFIILFALAIVVVAEECNDVIDNHLGTKTPYRVVGNLNHNRIEYSGCVPQKIWMLSRHGTRNPSREYIDVMKGRLSELKRAVLESDNELINSDLQLFEKWKVNLENDDEKLLTTEGANEMVLLAERMQARFPDILSNVYSNTSYQFKFTHTKRAKSSAHYFAIGLFGKLTAKDVWFPEPSTRDPILRFYKLCNKWRKTVKKNPDSLAELKKFKDSEIAGIIVANMEKKLGLKENALTFDDIQYMFITCAFETAWSRKKKSPWCTVIDLETSRYLEYAEDLKYYWIDGYGYNITYRQACPAFGDMFNHLDDPEPYPRAVLYFTHSGTLLKMIAHLGLYRDEEPLLADNMNENRQWKVSKIDSFGTNLAFVGFKCKTGKKVLLLHQERIVRFPFCPDTDLCDLSRIKEVFTESLDQCNFEDFCETNQKY